jgi:hypothetical protein
MTVGGQPHGQLLLLLHTAAQCCTGYMVCYYEKKENCPRKGSGVPCAPTRGREALATAVLTTKLEVLTSACWEVSWVLLSI